MDKLPGRGLWVHGVETQQEVSIGKVLESGGVVGHDVGVAWDVGGFRAVAVVALVGAVEAAEVGARVGASYCAFAEAGCGGDVVDQVGDGALAHVVEVGDDVVVQYGRCLLEVVDGDGTVRVVGSGELGLEARREGPAPADGGVVGSEDDSAEAVAAGVCGPDDAGEVRHQFAEVSGPGAQAGD